MLVLADDLRGNFPIDDFGEDGCHIFRKKNPGKIRDR